MIGSWRSNNNNSTGNSNSSRAGRGSFDVARNTNQSRASMDDGGGGGGGARRSFENSAGKNNNSTSTSASAGMVNSHTAGEGGVHRSGGASNNTTILPSSTELFYFYRETMERCAKLSNGQTFLELCGVYRKWLKVYAEEVLGGGLSKYVNENVLCVEILFHSKRNGQQSSIVFEKRGSS